MRVEFPDCLNAPWNSSDLLLARSGEKEIAVNAAATSLSDAPGRGSGQARTGGVPSSPDFRARVREGTFPTSASSEKMGAARCPPDETPDRFTP